MPGRYALLVGCWEYADIEIQQLVAPQHDIEALEPLLKDSKIGEFQIEALIKNEKAEVIRNALSNFFVNKSPDDLLLFYFSGHGNVFRNTPYLACIDYLHQIPYGQGRIMCHELTAMVKGCTAHTIILIFDCCFSGAFVQEMDIGPRRFVLTASDADQISLGKNRLTKQESLYTGLVNRALRGSYYFRNEITPTDLHDYVFNEIALEKVKNPDLKILQEPCYWVSHGKERVSLAHNPYNVGEPKQVDDHDSRNTARADSVKKVVTSALNEFSRKRQLNNLLSEQSLGHIERQKEYLQDEGLILDLTTESQVFLTLSQLYNSPNAAIQTDVMPQVRSVLFDPCYGQWLRWTMGSRLGKKEDELTFSSLCVKGKESQNRVNVSFALAGFIRASSQKRISDIPSRSLRLLVAKELFLKNLYYVVPPAIRKTSRTLLGKLVLLFMIIYALSGYITIFEGYTDNPKNFASFGSLIIVMILVFIVSGVFGMVHGVIFNSLYRITYHLPISLQFLLIGVVGVMTNPLLSFLTKTKNYVTALDPLLGFIEFMSIGVAIYFHMKKITARWWLPITSAIIGILIYLKLADITPEKTPRTLTVGLTLFVLTYYATLIIRRNFIE